MNIKTVLNRLQEMLDRVRHQGEEVRNLKVHIEQIEENRKDLENRLRRFEIGRHIFAVHVSLRYQAA